MKAKEVVGIKMPDDTTTAVDLDTFSKPRTKVYYYDNIFYRQEKKDSPEWLKWTNKVDKPVDSNISELEKVKQDIVVLRKWAFDIVVKFREYVAEKNDEVVSELKQYLDSKILS